MELFLTWDFQEASALTFLVLSSFSEPHMCGQEGEPSWAL